MRCLFALVLLIVSHSSLFGQSIEEVNKKLSELSKEKVQLESQLKQVESEFDRLTKIRNKLMELTTTIEMNSDKENFSVYSTIRFPSTLLMSKPVTDSDILFTFKGEERVEVIGYENECWKIKYQNIVGFVPGFTVKARGKMGALRDVNGYVGLLSERIKDGHVTQYLKAKIIERNKEKETRDKLKEENKKRKMAEKRKKYLVHKYGTNIAQSILDGQFWIGMTTSMAKESLGEPDHINTTGSENGISEQWVYGDKYLYFENGILRTWQY